MRFAFAGLRHAHILSLQKLLAGSKEHTIIGAWEQDEAAREAAGVAFPRWYPSLDALLTDSSVDVVAVGDMYGSRGDIVVRAMRAGKHVLSDKPICTSLDELAEIRKAQRETGLRVGCMLDLRYDPALRLAANLIRGGELGEVHTVSFTGQHPLNWGKRRMWYFESGKHGGTFNDIAVHGLDAVRMITGKRLNTILCARQWNAFAQHAPAFADCAQMMGVLTGGAGLQADVSYSAPSPAGFLLPSYWRFSFFGEDGWLETKYGEGKVRLLRSGDPDVRTIAAPAVMGTWLTDLCGDIAGTHPIFDTESVLIAAEDALRLQTAADAAR